MSNNATNIHEMVFNFGRDKARTMVAAAEKKFVDMASEFQADESGNILFSYSGFANLSLPHKELKAIDDVWTRQQGPYTLIVEPGTLPKGKGAVEKHGVPYGSRARLILLYLQTQAVANSSRFVELGASMTEWMGRMGIHPGGTNFAAVRSQTNRLKACHLTFSLDRAQGGNGYKRTPIISRMMTKPSEGGPAQQGQLWEEVVELSEIFYQSLTDHPVPCEERAIRLIQNSSTTIDFYIWICYRLHRLSKPLVITWEQIRDQFAPFYKQPRQFKYNFIRTTLKEIQTIYPQAKMEVLDRGLKLYPSSPAVAYKPSVQVLSIE